MIDRDIFFPSVRNSLFGGNLTQSQVDGMNYLLDVWEMYFEGPNPRDGDKWLAYCMATVFHETAKKMQPIEEYGKGSGKPYGQPAGPYNQKYYGRGHVQLTWETNYKKGQSRLDTAYNVVAELWPKPDLMLQNEISALVLYDGMSVGWFTGVGLPKYFNSTTEDPVNARRIVNGVDKADLIAGYYWKFKPAIAHTSAPPSPEPEPEPAPPQQPPTITISTDQTVWLNVNGRIIVLEASNG
jgi:putative chitinase